MKKKKIKVSKEILYIKWHDASGGDTARDSWETLEETGRIKPLYVISVGRLLHEDKKMIVLAANVAAENLKRRRDIQCCGIIQIPRSCIVEREVLKRL